MMMMMDATDPDLGPVIYGVIYLLPIHRFGKEFSQVLGVGKHEAVTTSGGSTKYQLHIPSKCIVSGEV